MVHEGNFFQLSGKVWLFIKMHVDNNKMAIPDTTSPLMAQLGKFLLIPEKNGRGRLQKMVFLLTDLLL